MQTSLPLRSLRVVLFLAATAGCLAACDRHSAGEVSEGYGHGSSHDKSFTDHKIDSTKSTLHFSDSQGTADPEVQGSPVAASPSPSGESTPAKHFF